MISNRVRFAVWGLMILGGLLASFIADALMKWKFWWPLSIPTGLLLLGISSYAAGTAGKWLAVKGKPSPKARFGELTRLVREGPYSCMRHPMHLFLSLTPVGVGLIASSPTMTSIVGPIETIIILAMAVTLDERESLTRFGEEYVRYREEVPPFNLRPSCLAKSFVRPAKTN